MTAVGEISLTPRVPRSVHTERSLRPQVDDTVFTPQVCRALACLLVAVYHGAALVDRQYGVHPLRGLSEFGFSGVHMFFVISGLIIYHAHRRDLGDPRNVSRYLLKRLVRIYPFYWIVFMVLAGRNVFSGRLELGDFLTNALFFSSSKSLVISVSWTLAYEMIFYGIFVAFIVKRSLGIGVFVAWFVLVALNHHFHFAGSFGLHLINSLFMLGMLTSVAVIALRGRLDESHRDRIGIAALAAGTVVFLCTAWYCLSLPDLNLSIWASLPLTFGFGTGSALLLFASVSGRIEGFLKRRRLLLLIGDASYSIYLVHVTFQARAFSAIRSLGGVPKGETTPLTAFLLLAAVLVVSVGGGILVHKLVEKPVLARSRAWLRIAKSAR